MISHHKWAFLQGVLPRLLHTGFCFGQPFLVERVLNFMNEPEHVNSTNYARGLVAAYAIVYIGIAVCGLSSIKRHLLTDSQISGAAYQHQTDRIIAMVRGSLVTLIFEKTLRMSTSVVADSGAITLMSTDIERISSCLREIHEVYSGLIEIVVALWLLARLLNVAVIASTIFVICKLSCLVFEHPMLIFYAQYV